MARALITTVSACVLALLVLTTPGAVWAQSAESIEPHESAWELFFQGRYAEAEVQARKAVELSEVKYGPNNPNTALRLSIRAKVYHAQRRFAEAESLYKRVLVIFEQCP